MKCFKDLVERYRHSIYTFAYYNLHNNEEAEDVTQEVLLRMWRNWQDLNEYTEQAWIRRVTQNACIDATRRRRAYRTRVVAGGDADDGFEAVSAEPTPDAAAVASELRGHIEEALSRVQEPYRSIVIFREIQDLKYDEICAVLDLPLNTVKSYLHRGRRMLRDQLRGIIGEST
jgi:RNA polymerase sigma-70 factor, ECF subfamily